MSLAPDPILGVIGDAVNVTHFVSMKGTSRERHFGVYYDFRRMVANLSSRSVRSLVVRLPRLDMKATRVVLSPSGPGEILGERVAGILEVPFVRAKERIDNCELINEQDEKNLRGRRCLLVDVCCDTGATLAGLARTANLHGGSVCAALVLLTLQRKINDSSISRLPLSFKVVSYTTREAKHWSPTQCPSCRQRRIVF